MLKGARPGLTVAQFRSLLINGASPASVAEGIAATQSQAGAGVMDLAAAVRGTVAAFPTALNFGAGKHAAQHGATLLDQRGRGA